MNLKAIFSEQSNAYDQLIALRNSGQAPAVFEELAVALTGRDVSLVGMVSVDREHSSAASAKTHTPEPCLSLFLTSGSFQESGVEAEDSNWSGTWTHTMFVREQWARICTRYQVPAQYYSNTMLIFVYDTQHLDVVQLVYRCKPLIGKFFPANSKSAPRIFVSSEPSISIVFPARAELKRARASGDLKRARHSILGILKNNDQYDCFSPARVSIRFLDPGTAGDFYDLARED